MKILESFKDANGHLDGKRISAFVFTGLSVISYAVDQITEYKLNEFAFGSILSAALISLGLTVPEILSKRRFQNTKVETEEVTIEENISEQAQDGSEQNKKWN